MNNGTHGRLVKNCFPLSWLLLLFLIHDLDSYLDLFVSDRDTHQRETEMDNRWWKGKCSFFLTNWYLHWVVPVRPNHVFWVGKYDFVSWHICKWTWVQWWRTRGCQRMGGGGGSCCLGEGVFMENKEEVGGVQSGGHGFWNVNWSMITHQSNSWELLFILVHRSKYYILMLFKVKTIYQISECSLLDLGIC